MTASREPKLTRWLSKELGIPAGELTILAGFEGTMKSTVVADIAARITKGTMPGEYKGKPRGVLIFAGEEDWDKSIVPRMKAAGANTDMIHGMSPENGGVMKVTDPEDLADIREFVKDHDIALIIFDPMTSTLGGRPVEKEEQLREALAPMIEQVCHEDGVAILGIKHFTKLESADAAKLLGGNRAWTAIARSSITVAPHPDNTPEGTTRFIIGVTKCNLMSEQDKHARMFSPTTAPVEIEGQEVAVPCIHWVPGDSDYSVNEALGMRVRNERALMRGGDEEGTKKKQPRITAYSWLTAMLCDLGAEGCTRDEAIETNAREGKDRAARGGRPAFSVRAIDSAWAKINDDGEAGQRRLDENKQAIWSLTEAAIMAHTAARHEGDTDSEEE